MRSVMEEEDLSRSDTSSSSSSSSSSSGEESSEGEEPERIGATPRPSIYNISEVVDEEKILIEKERALILSSGDYFRQYLFDVVNTKVFGFGIFLVIVINTLFIGIHTSHFIVAKAEWYLTLLDYIFLAVYMMELGMKLYVWRLNYFKQMWNVFDFVIVMASLVDFLIPLIVQNMANFNAKVFKVLRVFRAIRALRTLRVLRTIRSLQVIVTAVLQSIPAMGSILILISLVLYVFAIVGRGLYGEVDPDRFGNLARACFTLFQLITLDDWFFMFSDVMKKHPDHWHILIFLIFFIILETFVFINLFVAVIVDNLARTQAAATASKKAPPIERHRSDHGVDSASKHRLYHKLMASQQSGERRRIEDYYLADNHSLRERELLCQHFQLLASLEHHLQVGQNHQHTLNELVDLVDFSRT